MKRINLLSVLLFTVLALTGCGQTATNVEKLESGTTQKAAPEKQEAVSSAGKIVYDVGWNSGNSDIYIMNADGTGNTNISNSPEKEAYPVLTADGKKIVYHRPTGQNIWQIFTMNPDGSDLKQVTTEGVNMYPSWSWDGTKIIFNSLVDTKLEIFVMNADGTGRKQLTSFHEISMYARMSPDGQKIAFACGTGTKLDICTINADGSGLKKLTSGGKYSRHPAWSLDGKLITYTTEPVERESRIFVMNADGTGQKMISVGEGGKVPGAWGSNFSPDGTKIVYAELGMVKTANLDGSDVKILTQYAADLERPSWGK